MISTTMIRMIIKHKYQPTGNTCGPACLHMCGNTHTIELIADLCGTDWVVGTPPDRMIIGMDRLKMKYIHHTLPKDPYKLLSSIIDKGNIPILRTITQGVPHWIIVSKYTNTKYHILDPWLGEIDYTKEQLDFVWKLKNYELFEIIK